VVRKGPLAPYRRWKVSGQWRKNWALYEIKGKPNYWIYTPDLIPIYE
jgi:hypothetical protein